MTLVIVLLYAASLVLQTNYLPDAIPIPIHVGSPDQTFTRLGNRP